MPQIRVSDHTHERLTTLRKGLDTYDDVLTRLLNLMDIHLDLKEVYRSARTSVEADRAKGD